ncbi:MAG: right-handed parallel beta-helix repeat-containing protein [Sedimentisphaerales bacterium]|nr:right-handed parallel beta-helix repeat-containing protein [Sedimentisphaerales bacterium]
MKTKSGSFRVAVLAAAMVWAGGTDAAVRYVALDGSGANGLSWATAYRTIQDAVNDPGISSGDEIWVKTGTYVQSVPVQLHKAVKIYGGYTGSGSTRDWENSPTVLDAANTAKRGFDVYANAVIDGFTMTRGHAWGIPPNEGGGVWLEECAATVTNCTFYRNNSELNGGAIGTLWAHGSTISNCAFIENRADYYGGAIYNYNSNVTITGCTFTDNGTLTTPDDVGADDSIPGGGGIYNEYGHPTISDCTFSGNIGYYGSGLTNYFANAVIEGCTFADSADATEAGGGIYNYGGSNVIQGCLFCGNHASWEGGGAFDISTSTYLNCIMWDNYGFRGGGVGVGASTGDATSQAVFINCTMYGNVAVKGGGLYNDNATPTVTNSIIWGNSASTDSDGPGIFDSKLNWSGSGATVTYSDVQGSSTFEGTGNVRVEPGFVNAAVGNFELPFGAPCIDIGTNDVTGLPTVDYEGKPRVRDGDEDGVAIVDMGAFEFRGRYINDYLLQARIFYTKIYDSPSDGEATNAFVLECETFGDVDHISFDTANGLPCTIPSTPYNGAFVKTSHTVVDGRHLWRYWVQLNPLNPPGDYGDGTYTIRVHYPDSVQQETDFWYGVPGTSTYLTAPSQKPNVTSPSYAGATASPATLTWDACTDPAANHVSVTILDAGDDVVLSDVLDVGETSSGAYTLNEGHYAAEVAFERSYEVTNADGIPFDYGKAVLVGHEMEVVYSTMYRFWSHTMGRHFYTISGAERDYVMVTWPVDWTYEGPVYHAYATNYVPGLASVYRFWSPTLRSHFYTIDLNEKNYVLATWPDVWTYEGVAFYAFPPDGPLPAGVKPVYRFWNEQGGSHFYTMSEVDRAYVQANYPFFIDEGIVFYAYE